MGEADSRNEEAKGATKSDPFRGRRTASGPWIGIVFVVAALVVSIAIVQGSYHRGAGGPNGKAPDLPPPRPVTTAAPSPIELSNTFREVAKAIKPAVVFINVVEGGRSGGEEVMPFPRGIPMPSPRREGAGSGFIVTPDGYILT